MGNALAGQLDQLKVNISTQSARIDGCVKVFFFYCQDYFTLDKDGRPVKEELDAGAFFNQQLTSGIADDNDFIILKKP